MVISENCFFKVQSEFSVKSTKIISQRQPLLKLFVDQSGLNALPTGCVCWFLTNASESALRKPLVDNGKLMLHLNVGSDAKQVNNTQNWAVWEYRKKKPLLRLVVWSKYRNIDFKWEKCVYMMFMRESIDFVSQLFCSIWAKYDTHTMINFNFLVDKPHDNHRHCNKGKNCRISLLTERSFDKVLFGVIFQAESAYIYCHVFVWFILNSVVSFDICQYFPFCLFIVK